MQKYTYCIGIDVSKHTINACVLQQDTKVFETCVANNLKGFKVVADMQLCSLQETIQNKLGSLPKILLYWISNSHQVCKLAQTFPIQSLAFCLIVLYFTPLPIRKWI